MESLDEGFMRCIKQSIDNKNLVVTKVLRDKYLDWRIEDGLVLCQERIYVPQNKKLREDIIQAHHDSVVAGHPGQKGTQELITRNYV